MALYEDSFSLLVSQISSDAACVRNKFALIGTGCACVALGACAFYSARSLYYHFSGSFNVRHRLRRYGRWAVVTGCTSGVGLEFSRQLAAMGFDLILMGRRDDALSAIASELEEMFGVHTVRIKIDFNQGSHIYADIRDSLKEKDIGVLVNNVGVMYEFPQYFTSVSEDKLWELIHVNMASAITMTHMVLRDSMLPNKRGLILFMSSSACYQPTPQMSAYAATKKYLDYFSRSLYAEYRPMGIHIQSLVPFYIATPMTSYSDMIGKPGIISPHPSTYVRHALWTAGMTSQSTGYFPHSVMLFFSHFVPESAWTWIANRMMTYFRTSVLSDES